MTELKHLNPLVQWAQSAKAIFLRVEVGRVKEPEVLEFTEDSVHFRAVGQGQRGTNDYEFFLRLYGKISSEDCVWKVLGERVELTLPKAELSGGTDAWWPSLQEGKKPAWLKVDFSRWRSEEDEKNSEEEMDEAEAKAQAEETVRKLLEENGWSRASLLEDYLVAYNVGMFLAFLFILAQLIVGFAQRREAYFKDVWSEVSPAFKTAQLAMWLDVANAAAGFTKTQWQLATVQVGMRFYLFFVVLSGDVVMQDKPFVFLLFLVYAAIEVVRYPFYALAVKKKELWLLTWLRYNAWIPLYPLGIFTEGVILLRSLPLYLESGTYSWRLPNQWNFGFELSYFNGILLCVMMPAGAVMLSHMRKQRLNRMKRDRARKIK